ESFKAYARAMPNNCVFLVDTYDSLEGVRNACRVGKWLRDEGYEMVGIRLDSGDLAYLSKKARDIMDEEGFPDAAIVASNDLDEHTIHSLKDQDAKIALWGVGTRLATAHDDPAMGGVYKLSAVREPGSEWEYRLKLSEQRIKTTNPGILQVRRFCEERDDGNTEFIADMIYHLDHVPDKESTMIDPLDATRKKHFEADKKCEDLLKPIFEKGKLVYEKPSLDDIRDRASAQLASFHEGVKRFSNPHEYPVGLEKQLNDMKTRLMEEAREEIES
ncbi:MAG: nicotinate phosphoribosyltransferase, partial [Candidatus Sumerlaeota bacterium]